MAETTSIGWCDATINFWWGCTEVSPECDGCYARQFDRFTGGKNWGKDNPRKFVRSAAELAFKLNQNAAKHGTRPLVFCSSMSDLLETHTGPVIDHRGQQLFWNGREPRHLSPETSDEPACLRTIRERIVWPTIAACRNLIWLLLSKRPAGFQRMMPDELIGADHIWLGTTVGLMSSGHRLASLLQIPAALHFVSMEPQLESIDLERLPVGQTSSGEPQKLNALSGRLRITTDHPPVRLNRLGWIISGGESKQGKNHQPRQYDLAWPRELIVQATPYDVPVQVKQLGHNPVQNGKPLQLRDSKGEDTTEWPADLKIQQRPEISV